MQTSPDTSIQIIDNYDAVRLLINVYLIKKIKRVSKPINQEKFIDTVRREYKSRNYDYPRKRILYTWKYLLENYQFYKAKFADGEAKKAWIYFELMDNCFDDSKQTSEKFRDSKWTFFLIESLVKHKTVVLQHGLTMDVLQAVEDDFRRAQNFNINQKDVNNQWMFLKRFFRQNQRTGYYKHLTKNHAYFTALKTLFAPEPHTGCRLGAGVDENELDSAIDSIKEQNAIEATESFITENVSGSCPEPFTIVMHDVLLQCFKRHKTKIQNLNGSIDNELLKEAFEEFQKLGYNVTQQSILNEWNDLSCRYELIKIIEHPEKWLYYNDINYIYKDKSTDEANVEDDKEKQNTDGTIVENLRKTQNAKRNDYVKLTERLLNVYESNGKEYLEIKDILIERNLLKEETNYLLNMFVEKFNKNGMENFPS